MTVSVLSKTLLVILLQQAQSITSRWGQAAPIGYSSRDRMSDLNAFGYWKFIHWLFGYMLIPIPVKTLQWGNFIV